MNANVEQSKTENLGKPRLNLGKQWKHLLMKRRDWDSLESSEFALKMINAVKSMNMDEISHYEMVNSFTLADELKCLFMFIKALPYNPIVPMYPEAPFLFFKGVVVLGLFDLTEEIAMDIETFMKVRIVNILKIFIYTI